MAKDFGDDYVHSRCDPYAPNEPEKTTSDDELGIIMCLTTALGFAAGMLVGWLLL